MPYVVKAALAAEVGTEPLTFFEKTMYGGRNIAVDDEVFVFWSDHEGGRGLCATGVVTSVEAGPGVRRTVVVRPTATATRRLGRTELRPYRDVLDDSQPEAEVARKIYRQATNKIAGISEPTAAFLRTYF
jgi:hypothetical protein